MQASKRASTPLKANQFQAIHLLLLLAIFVMTAGLASCQWGSIGYNQGYEPEQPVAFSHELHAGTYKVPCLYCHQTAERAKHSSVPSLNICMNCHLILKTEPGSPTAAKLEKLREAYDNNTPVPWVKVHMLPDHVKFNHKRHVEAFGAPQACHKCHGPVETMAKVYQHSNLSMGWCVNCHREPEHQAPISCSTCHY